MESKPTLRELIDACRPDHDDPQRSELAAELSALARELGGNAQVRAAYERSQQFDRQVRSALDDVTLPAGLAERMLAGCEAALVEPAEKEAGREEARRASKGVSRRTMVLVGLAIAGSLVLVMLGIGSWPKPNTLVTAEQLAQSALQWRDQVTPVKLAAISQQTKTAFPVDPAVIVSPSRVAQLSPNVVAYELVGRDISKRAFLIVQKTKQPHAFLRNYPSTQLPSSGPTILSAWQRNGYVYIVIFDSDNQTLKDYVKAVKVT